MALDKLTKLTSQSGITTTIDYQMSDLTVDTITVQSGGIKMPVGMSTFQNVTVTGDLTVNGTTTTLDTDLIGVDKLEVSGTNTTAVGIITQAGSGDILRLYDNTTQVFTVQDGGKLLLGTTTEGHTSGDDLTIATSDTTGITLRGGTSGGGRIFFSDGTSGTAEYEGVVGYDHSTNHLYFSTNHTERLRITSAGNVGIGTDNPSADYRVTIKSSTSPHSALLLDTTESNYNTNLYFAKQGTNKWVVGNKASDDSFRIVSGSTQRLSINSGGQVSISGAGTTFGVNTLLNIAPANRTSAFDPSDGDTWHDVVLKQTGSATNNAVGICFETSTSGYHKNAGTGIAAVKNGTNSDYGSHLVFVTRPQSGAASEKLRISDVGALGIAGANYGTAGQVIKSAGSGSAVAWGDATVGVSSAGTSIGNATTLNFIGAGNTFAVTGSTIDVSIAGGGGGGGSGQFNTGLTNEFYGTASGIGSTVFTAPSTSGKKYILTSLLATNVAVGNTDVNVIGAFDFDGGERSYFAYNIPLPVGMAAELLKQPMVLNPSDKVLLRSTDIDRNGVDTIVEYYGTYEMQESVDLVGVGLGSATMNDTSAKTLYTSSGAPSVIQSIRIANITDSGPKPLSISITHGSDVIRLVENLIVPKYASVEILDNQKRISSGAIVKVTLDEGSSMGVQLSAKKISES